MKKNRRSKEMHKMRVDKDTIKQQQKLLEERLKNTRTASAHNLTITIPLKIENHEKAILEFTQDAMTKIKTLVKLCDKEIAWHGTVTKGGTKKKPVYTVTDVFMFPQEVTAATVKGIPSEYAVWNASLPDEIYSHMRFHGHSHVNMGVTPSGVDTNYQEEMLETLEDFYIFLIINKRDDMWTKIVDVQDNIVYDKEDIEVRVTGANKFDDWAAKTIKENLKEVTVVRQSTVTPAKTAHETYSQMVMSQIDQRKKEETKTEEQDRYGVWGRYAEDWYRGYMG